VTVPADRPFASVSLQQLRRRRSEKWTRYPADVLPCAVAEMDFAPASEITAVLARALADGDLGYAYPGASGLATAFRGFAGRRWGWQIDRDAVVAVPDVMVGVAELLRGLTEPGAGVVITPPVYPPFFSVIAETGRRAVPVPLLGPDAGRRLPIEGIRDAFADGARALLLCNPHNPTGYVADRAELLAVAEIVGDHEGVVLSDEIHGPLTLAGSEHVPFCSLPDEAGERAITLTSASKAWNLAGLKCGLAVASSERMRRALEALPLDLRDRVGHLGVLASEAAFTAGEPWLDELLRYLEDTRGWLRELLADRLPLVGYTPGVATYLAWLDCRELGLGEDPAACFLARGRVALSPGADFGAAGRGFARLNFGTSRALIAEAVERIRRAVSAAPGMTR
jgi:cysteine-S-conjugate beta-lyase